MRYSLWPPRRERIIQRPQTQIAEIRMLEQTIINSRSGQPSIEEEVRVRKHSQRFDLIALGLGALGLIAMTVLLESLLTPFVVIVALYMILTPYREYKAAKTIMWTAGLLFAFWFFVTLSSLLIPFIIGLVIAYLFNPLVTKLHKRYGATRGVWSLLFMTLFVVFFGILGWLLVPQLVLQARSFFTQFTVFISSHANDLDERNIRKFLMSLGLPRSLIDQMIAGQIALQMKALLASLPTLLFHLLSKLPQLLERVVNLIIIPIAGFYFLKDWPKMGELLRTYFPAKNPSRRKNVMHNIDRVLYSYVRGQLTVATIIGVLAAIAYSIMGLPYAGLLGLIVGLTDLIPVIGIFFSIIIVEIVVLLTMQITPGVIFGAAGVILCLHAIESYGIGPKIVGEGIGIPPVLMIISLFIFGYFLGIFGMIIAVPTTGILLLFLEDYREMQNENITVIEETEPIADGA